MNNNHPNPGFMPPFPPGPPPPGSPFWDFVSSAAGVGVDHTNYAEHGFNFGPDGFNAWSGPRSFGWGRRGRGGPPRGGPPFGPFGPFGPSGPFGRGGRGRRHHGRGNRSGDEEEDLYDITAAAAAAEAEMEQGTRDRDPEKADSPETMHDADGEHPDPPEEVPTGSSPGRRHGCRGRRGGFFGRGRGGRHGPPFGGPPFGGPPFGGGPPPWAAPGFDFAPFMEAMGNHRFAQRIRDYIEQIRRAQRGGNAADNEEGVTEEEGSFTPPIDVFDTSNNWTIHVAIPGARKEDIGVNWDADRKTLTVSGVVHRLGDEQFINSMVSSERRVGAFERKIQLPPVEVENEKNDEVDGDNITAKMENGILIVIVPKAEKEWTEIKKVDIL